MAATTPGALPACAAWTTRGRFKAAFASSFNCLFDLKEAVIVDVAATPTRISRCWAGWSRDIDPHIPVWEQSEIGQEGRFSCNDLHFDAGNDLYVCPNGKTRARPAGFTRR